MYIAFLIFNIIGCGLFAFALVSSDESDKVFLALSCMVFIIGFMIHLSDNSPTALDVYQGKTTLEITYKDSIAIDSTVVFKREK